MAMRLLGTSFAATLRRTLDYAATRHRYLSHNLTNVETPGFRRVDVVFPTPPRHTGTLPLRRTRPAHIAIPENNGFSPSAGGQALVSFRDPAPPRRPDGNNVDVEVELVRVAETELLYRAALRFLQGHVRGLRRAITEGRA